MKILKTRMLLMTAAVIAVTISGSFNASANLILNGDFETGDFSDWTQSGSSGYTSIDGPHTGIYGWSEGAMNSPHFLSQDIATTIGTDYDISFWLKAYGGGGSEYVVIFGGTTLYDVVDEPGPNDWQLINLIGVATSTDTTITFGIRQDSNSSQLDDISVDAVVPDGAFTASLLGATFLGLAFFRSKQD